MDTPTMMSSVPVPVNESGLIWALCAILLAVLAELVRIDGRLKGAVIVLADEELDSDDCKKVIDIDTKLAEPEGEVDAGRRPCEVDGNGAELVSNGDVAREPPPELGVKEDVGLNTVLEGYDV